MKTNKNCRQIRTRLYELVDMVMGPDAAWVQRHIAQCPRCRKRVASAGRVRLALSLIKSQGHNLDLLMRANAQAIGVLKHSLRTAPKALKLKTVKPEPNLFERLAKYKSSAVNAAACVAILFLMKIGVFSSMDKFQSHSKELVRNYYAANAGQDIADEIFSA